MKLKNENVKRFIKNNWISLLLGVTVSLLGGIILNQNNKIDELESDISNCESDKYDLENELQNADYRIEELESEIDICQTKLSICIFANADLESDLSRERFFNR
jgi:peptidoglycan hydrolase CwlO-like protein